MYASLRRDSNSPERERHDERSRGPRVCTFKTSRLCPLSARKECHDLHLDGGDLDQDDDDVDDRSNRGSERTWRDERAPRDEPRRDDRSLSNERSCSVERSLRSERSHSSERTYHDERRYRNESTNYDKKNRLGQQKSSEICNMFTMGLCSRGKSCPDVHPGVNDSQERRAEEKKTCLYFVRGLCKLGGNCKNAHPEPDLRSLVQKKVWLKFCKKKSLQKCEANNCSYLHICIEDEELYKKSGLISGNALGQALRKAIQFNIPLEDDKPVCKEKLDDYCNIINCPFLHITREEFIRRVLGELKSEFEKVYGMSKCVFDSVKTQQDIIQNLLSPALTNTPSALLMVPSMPVVTPFMKTMAGCSPPPSMIAMQPTMINTMAPVGIQPTATDHWDNIPVNTVLVDKLCHANEQITKENEKYQNYIRVLREENFEMMRALNPDQAAVDVNDIQRRILSVFEAINWKSSLKLMDKLTDYGHKDPHEEKPKHPNQEGPNWQTNKQFSDNYLHDAASALSVPQMPPRAVRPSKIPSRKPPARPPRMHQSPPSLMGISWDKILTGVSENATNSQSDPMEVITAPVTEVNQKRKTLDSKTDKVQKFYSNWVLDQHFSVLDQHLQQVGQLPEIEDSDEEDDEDEPKKKKKKKWNKKKVDYYGDKNTKSTGKIWVNGFTEAHDKDSIDEYFRGFGILKRTVILPTSGIIYFKDPSIAQQVLEQTEPHVIKGVAVSIKDGAELIKMKQNDVGKILIDDLTPEHDMKTLLDYFVTFGSITWSYHMSKFAYITFEDPSIAEKLIQQNEPQVICDAAVIIRAPDAYGTGIRDYRAEHWHPYQIFVTEFSSTHDKTSLAEYFGKYGRIVNMRLKKYFGYILFADTSSVQKILDQSEPHVVNRFEITVRKCEAYHGSVEKFNTGDGKIKVDGLTEAHDSDSIEEYFSGFGNLKRMIILPTHAILTFKDPSIAQQVYEQSEPHVINGVAVSINEVAEIESMKTNGVGKILVENLTAVHTKETLLDHFKTFGRVVWTKRMSTYAFVTFLDASIAEELIQQTKPHVINDAEVSIRAPQLCGTNIRKNKNEEESEKRAEENNSTSKEEDQIDDEPEKQADEESQVDPPDAFYKVFVGGMNKDLTENDMQEYFSVFGEIYTVELRKDKKERSRGFGFVTFCDYEVAKAVVSKDCHVMSGITITVKQATQNVTKPSKRNRYVQVERSAEKQKLPSDNEDVQGSNAKRPATPSVLNEEMAEELDLLHAKELGLMDEDQNEDTNFDEQEDYYN